MTHIPLPRTTPEAQGIASAAIADFVTRADQEIQHLHSFMLLRHGSVVAEGWWHPYRPDTPHVLFSLSKSFTSTAVGLAVAEGRLCIDDPVLKFFPEDAPKKVSQNLAAMKVRHLLSMSCGHDQDSTERTMRGRYPFKAFLAIPVKHKPGTHFVYNSGASYMLAAIVQKLTRQTLVEYLTPRIFEPLGIEGAYWESHPNGVNFGGWGLNIKTEDIARFGQLYLQKGNWQGKQLLPAAWVSEASSSQVSNAMNQNPDWKQGYGFQFWRCQPEGVYRGDGAFGQYCVVMPKQDAVLAITAGVANMQPPLSLVWDILLPAIKPAALPADTSSAQVLASKLKTLAILPPPGKAAPALAAKYSGKTFVFEPNPLTLQSINLDFDTHTLVYQTLGGPRWLDQPLRGEFTLSFGSGAWLEGTVAYNSQEPRRAVSSGVWTAKDTFTLTVCQYETPFTNTLVFTFGKGQVTLQFNTNVGFGPTELPAMVGRLEELK